MESTRGDSTSGLSELIVDLEVAERDLTLERRTNKELRKELTSALLAVKKSSTLRWHVQQLESQLRTFKNLFQGGNRKIEQLKTANSELLQECSRWAPSTLPMSQLEIETAPSWSSCAVGKFYVLPSRLKVNLDNSLSGTSSIANGKCPFSLLLS